MYSILAIFLIITFCPSLFVSLDESHGLDWQTRYKIIKGTCEGLKYLHKGLENPMFHLDLKPGNILLDKNMVPKLADFGLSKLVCDNQTQAASNFLGTM
jgi:interleukin-1 receptor-associated kinase 1/coatomer subunit beta'